ncbi:EAL domain-containing protein [Oceanobacillus longus]|uniref:EAL domain-containing protein n=1 Tax=Oceanobacillus longus TaxID=930120 RepID=A0ABV8H2Z7_9BACI
MSIKKSKFRNLFKRNIYSNNHAIDKQNTKGNALSLPLPSLAFNHPDLIIAFSPYGDIISQTSKRLIELLGSRLQTKNDFLHLFPESTSERLDTLFTNTLGGKSENIEIEVNKNNGQQIQLLLTFIPIRINNNHVEGIYLIINDLTEHVQLEQSLERMKKHLNHSQQIAAVGSWEYIINDDKFDCSINLFDTIGIDESENISIERLFTLVHSKDYSLTRQKFDESTKKGNSFATEFRILHGKTNELRYITAQAECIKKDGIPYRLVGVIKDDTSYKRLENELKNQITNLQHIYDHLKAGIWLRENTEGKMVFASKGLVDILKCPLKRIYEDPDYWKQMVSPDYRTMLIESINLLKKGQITQNTFEIECPDGKTKWLQEQTFPWMNDEGEIAYLFGMVLDITDELEMHDKLNFLAYHDALTNMPNQHGLYNKLDSLCQANQPFALLYLDLDRFNVINDSLGYHVGDELLKEVASGLIAIISQEGYISRISGTDFVIVMENYKDKDSIFRLAEQLMKHIQKPVTIEEFDIQITTSIGISFFPEHGESKLTLIENAHSALYRAKRQGKNNYKIYSDMKDISSYKKYILDKDMRKALKNEEFEIYYQPKVNTEGIIVGAEALLRWNHHEWGLVSPGEFIPIAEENHFINDLGDWVIKEVCVQLKEWKEKGLTLRPIAINLSPIRLMKKGLVEYVKQQLELYQIPGNYLEFEITEESLLKSDHTVLSTLEDLKSIGTTIAIDDFGTGYSSLQYLREIHADTLKIDKIFVQHITDENKVDAAIVSSTMHLAKGLGLKVVAEGVEEYEQLEFLKQNECDIIQGYLFSKPVALETFEQMLQTGYLLPSKKKLSLIPEVERRAFYRFEFPYRVLGNMTITEVNHRKVSLGATPILIENISLGGIKIVSLLKLPINSDMKFMFAFTLMNELFELEGTLTWKNDAKGDMFFYGVKFNLNTYDEDRLAPLINQLSVLQNTNQQIPNTDFVYEDSFSYLHKQLT